jgi:hypothetical protein
MLVSDAGYVPEPFFLFETLRSQTSRFHDPFGDSLLSKSRSVEGFRQWSESQSASRAQSKSRNQSKSRPTSPQRKNTSEILKNPTSRKKDAMDASGRITPIHTVLNEMGQPQKDTSVQFVATPTEEQRGPFGQSDSPRSPQSIAPNPSHSGTLLVRSSRPLRAPPGTSIAEEMDEELMRGRSGTLPPGCRKVRDNCYEMHLPSLVTPAASSAPGGNVKRIRYAVLEVS